ncbi:MAG: hypothetical protein WA971_05005 [Microbacterium sp.]
MRAAVRRTGIVVMGLAAALSAVGCSALLLSSDQRPSTDTAETPSAQHARDAACEVVDSEWGWALEPWDGIASAGRNDFAQEKVEHQAMISDLQAIADRVDAPEVRGVLETTIDVHQKYADEIWQALADVPPG